MKLFFYYLKYKRWALRLCAAFAGVFMVSFMLYHLPLEALVYPAALCFGIGVLYLLWDFGRVRHYHRQMQQIQSMTDVILEEMPEAGSVLEQDHRQILTLLQAEHCAEQTRFERRYAEMSDYYTVWAHQIKTPIASMRLRLQREDSALARSLSSDLNRIEQYVEMVLAFLRLDAKTTDYVFRSCDLDGIVRQAVKKFSAEFIGRKLRLEYQPLDTTVITDEKWLTFVVEQVLSNALKYTPSGSIRIALKPEKILCIQDTGIGIAPEDLPRIFEKGYTGYNGRTDKRASGIGLYLCKRICDALGHTITAYSIPDEGTAIEIGLAQTALEVE